jgi:hypothetical protein
MWATVRPWRRWMANISYSNVTSSAIADILPQNYQQFGYTLTTGTATTTGSTYGVIPASLGVTYAPQPASMAPRVVTAMDWLKDRISEMTAVGHEVLAA